jgi:hypothetical protein
MPLAMELKNLLAPLPQLEVTAPTIQQAFGQKAAPAI